MELTLVVHKEDANYWSETEQLPGCFASGGTLDELALALKEAVGLYLDDDQAELRHGPLEVGEHNPVTVTASQPARRP